MRLSLAISLAAAVISAGSVAWLLATDARLPLNRVLGTLLGGVCLWACADAVRTVSPDAASALGAARLGYPGWMFLGPLALHLALSLGSAPGRRWRAALGTSYVLAGGFLALSWTTPWMIRGAEPSPWGWWLPRGPLFPVFYLFTLANVAPAVALGLRSLREGPSVSGRNVARWVGAGVVLPLVGASLSNVALPLLGIPAPRLGALSFAGFGALAVWGIHQYGYSPLQRGSLSRQILDAHPDGVALVLLDGTIGTASEGLARLAGLPAEALVGRALDALLEPRLVDPPVEVRELEGQLAAAGGHAIPVALSTRIFRDAQGHDFALVVVIRDLREVVGLRSRLVTSGRLAAIGQLAAGIAHEINNPMAFVRTNLTLLRSHWERLAKGGAPPGERTRVLAEGEELLDESLEGVDRACTIVRDINSFSHAGSDERAPVDLHGLLDNVLRVAAPHLRRGIAVERRLGPLPPIRGAEQELKQLFLNLVLNAAHATGGSGHIRLVTRAEPDAAVVQVQDDGCGIEPDAMEKIFDPFFTTKPVGEGTGMGLFISYQIVRSHGGTVHVESEPGRGTTVTLRLPVDPE